MYRRAGLDGLRNVYETQGETVSRPLQDFPVLQERTGSRAVSVLYLRWIPPEQEVDVFHVEQSNL